MSLTASGLTKIFLPQHSSSKKQFGLQFGSVWKIYYNLLLPNFQLANKWLVSGQCFDYKFQASHFSSQQPYCTVWTTTYRYIVSQKSLYYGLSIWKDLVICILQLHMWMDMCNPPSWVQLDGRKMVTFKNCRSKISRHPLLSTPC